MTFTVKKAQSVDLNRLRSDILNLQSSLVEWRRKLHQKPELGFQEHLTAQFIEQKLEEWQIPHQTEKMGDNDCDAPEQASRYQH